MVFLVFGGIECCGEWSAWQWWGGVRGPEEAIDVGDPECLSPLAFRIVTGTCLLLLSLYYLFGFVSSEVFWVPWGDTRILSRGNLEDTRIGSGALLFLGSYRFLSPWQVLLPPSTASLLWTRGSFPFRFLRFVIRVYRECDWQRSRLVARTPSGDDWE